MISKLSKEILELYKTVSGDKNVTYDMLRIKFSNAKIYEPLLHSAKLFGKVPTNKHILEGEIEEEPIQKIAEIIWYVWYRKDY